MDETPGEYQDMHAVIKNSSGRFGSKDFIISIDQGKSISFKEFDMCTSRVANFLDARGITKSDRISLVGKNSIETLIIFFGVLRHGAIINPINSEESNENILSIIQRVKPEILIYDHEMELEFTSHLLTKLPFADFDVVETEEKELFSLSLGTDTIFRNPHGDKDDIAEILFTSGTTESPKGVAISREGLFYMIGEVIDKLGITDVDRILEYRAYNWASAQLLTILSSMAAGATLFLAKRFSRSRFPIWLKESGITICAGVPTVINMLVSKPVKLHKKDVPALKFITSSSAPLSSETHREFERIYGIQINQMGGQTEAGWMFGNPPGKRKDGSVGTAFKYKDIYVMDEHGRRCKPGEEGELVIKGKSVGIGYLNEYGGITRFPEEGIFTGDLGYKDSDGYVFITGRKKDLIIRGGVNISPLEITNRLIEHPFVKEAVTVGIPDNIYGEEIASFIVPKEGFKIEMQDILNHCKETLPDFKIPKIIRLLQEIPKTKNEKISKEALLELIGVAKSVRTAP